MGFALIKAAKAISAQRLHDPHVNIGIVVLHEYLALKLDEISDPIDIVIEQFLAEPRWQIRLSIVQKRSDIILQRAFATALIVQENWIALAQHHIA